MGAVEELIEVNRMIYSAVRHRLPGKQSLKVELKSFRVLADALRMTPSMQAEVPVRSFRRGEETRLLVEHYRSDSGQIVYILERKSAAGDIKVATRENEV